MAKIKLKYINKDKRPDENGWILDKDFLSDVEAELDTLIKAGYNFDFLGREDIEAVLLVANGEGHLLLQDLEAEL